MLMAQVLTVKQILKFAPCWDLADVRKAVGNGITIGQLLDRVWARYGEEIFSPIDCIWLLTRDNVLPLSVHARVTELIVTRCIRKYVVGTAIDHWAQGWLNGSDRSFDAANNAYRIPCNLSFSALCAIRAAMDASHRIACGTAYTGGSAANAVGRIGTANDVTVEYELQLLDFRTAIEEYK